MASARTFHIRPVLDGRPLAAAMARLLPGRSPGEANRLIRQRYVQLNGNVVVDEARRLKAGDVVKVFEHPLAAPVGEEDVAVRYADEHLVVVEKPAGVTTLRQKDEGGRPHRRRDRMPTLEEMLQRVMARRGPPPAARHTPATRAAQAGPAKHPLARRGQSSRGGGDGARTARHARPPGEVPRELRVRPVHRLDHDTSGLMIFALSPDAEHALTQLFKAHAIERKYLAVVHGHPAAQTVESYFVRDRGDGLRGSSPRGKDDPSAQHAVTHIRPVERIGDYSVLECRLETGRTHQIRIHLAEIGHPLCGEKTYRRAASDTQPSPDRSGAPRQALHSHELTLTHPATGENLHFESPLPPDLAAWIQRLRRGIAK
jgi:23S rRNA pseudouridine1911/1915/1917 synthase